MGFQKPLLDTVITKDVLALRQANRGLSKFLRRFDAEVVIADATACTIISNLADRNLTKLS